MPKSKKEPATIPYSVRLSSEMREEIKKTVSVSDLKFPEVIRQALKFGLPVVREKFGASAS